MVCLGPPNCTLAIPESENAFFKRATRQGLLFVGTPKVKIETGSIEVFERDCKFQARLFLCRARGQSSFSLGF